VARGPGRRVSQDIVQIDVAVRAEPLMPLSIGPARMIAGRPVPVRAHTTVPAGAGLFGAGRRPKP
jgi:hypothetical protein